MAAHSAVVAIFAPARQTQPNTGTRVLAAEGSRAPRLHHDGGRAQTDSRCAHECKKRDPHRVSPSSLQSQPLVAGPPDNAGQTTAFPEQLANFGGMAPIWVPWSRFRRQLVTGGRLGCRPNSTPGREPEPSAGIRPAMPFLPAQNPGYTGNPHRRGRRAGHAARNHHQITREPRNF